MDKKKLPALDEDRVVVGSLDDDEPDDDDDNPDDWEDPESEEEEPKPVEPEMEDDEY